MEIKVFPRKKMLEYSLEIKVFPRKTNARKGINARIFPGNKGRGSVEFRRWK